MRCKNLQIYNLWKTSYWKHEFILTWTVLSHQNILVGWVRRVYGVVIRNWIFSKTTENLESRLVWNAIYQTHAYQKTVSWKKKSVDWSPKQLLYEVENEHTIGKTNTDFGVRAVPYLRKDIAGVCPGPIRIKGPPSGFNNSFKLN